MRLASNPVEAKAHGAWLGAGTGVGLAQAAVAVIQAALGHPLAQGYVTGIYVVAGPLLAFIGAYLAPHTPRLSRTQSLTLNPEEVSALSKLLSDVTIAPLTLPQATGLGRSLVDVPKATTSGPVSP